jgi:putative flavoprotein involved in K+ transport
MPPPEPEEEVATLPEVPELDLRKAGVRTVIWANGFRPDHSWIEGVQADSQGWPVQHRGVTDVPGLYFVGLHWLHKRKSALFVGVGEDAEYVVEHLSSRMAQARES